MFFWNLKKKHKIRILEHWSNSTQYRSFRRRGPWAEMCTSHSIMEGQRHNNPLNPRCFCLQRPKRDGWSSTALPQSPTQWGLGPPGQLQLQQRLVVRPLQTERLRITLSWCINNKTNTLTQTHCLEMIFLSYTVASFVIFFTLSETQHRSFGVPAHFNRELSGGYRRGKGSEWENPRAVFLQKDENLKLRHWRI